MTNHILFVSDTVQHVYTVTPGVNPSWGCNCVCGPMRDGSICNITLQQLYSAWFESGSRSRQNGTTGMPEQRGSTLELMGRVRVCDVWDSKTEREASYGKTNYSASTLCLGEQRCGSILQTQAHKQRSFFCFLAIIHRHHTHTPRHPQAHCGSE